VRAPHVSPLAPPPYRAEIGAGYDVTWAALVRAVAKENLPLRPSRATPA